MSVRPAMLRSVMPSTLLGLPISRFHFATRGFATASGAIRESLDLSPGCVRVVDRHLSSGCVSLRAQISFPHDAVLIDDERHDPGRVVLRWPGDEGESSRHLALDD